MCHEDMGAAAGVRVSDKEGRKEKGPLPWKYAWPNKCKEMLLPTSAPTPQPFGFPDDGSHDRTDLRCLSIDHTCVHRCRDIIDKDLVLAMCLKGYKEK